MPWTNETVTYSSSDKIKYFFANYSRIDNFGNITSDNNPNIADNDPIFHSWNDFENSNGGLTLITTFTKNYQICDNDVNNGISISERFASAINMMFTLSDFNYEGDGIYTLSSPIVYDNEGSFKSRVEYMTKDNDNNSRYACMTYIVESQYTQYVVDWLKDAKANGTMIRKIVNG